MIVYMFQNCIWNRYEMLLDLLKLKEKYNLNIIGVIHIGAHFGCELNSYKSVGIDNILFFEPLPDTFQILKSNIGNEAIAINVALGNFNGEVVMNVETANLGQSSSILEPLVHLRQYPHIKFDNKIKVAIAKLDDFINIKNNYNFINIDVQGYELEVLKGGKEFLGTIDYIMTEVNRDEVYLGCAKIDEIDDYLKHYGFSRVETTWDGGTWGDAFYIK